MTRAVIDTRQVGWPAADALRDPKRCVSLIVDDRLPGEPYYDETADYAIAVASHAEQERVRAAHAAGPHWIDTAELVAALIASGVAQQVGDRLAELVDNDVCDQSVTTEGFPGVNDSRVTVSDLRIRRWLEAPPSGLERLALTSQPMSAQVTASHPERCGTRARRTTCHTEPQRAGELVTISVTRTRAPP